MINSSRETPLQVFQALLYRPVIPIDGLMDYEGHPLKTILSYWRRKQLVPFVGEGRGLKVSFAQLIWLRMLDSLRQLGYSVNNMSLLCAYLFERAYKDDLPKKNLQGSRVELNKMQVAGTLDDEQKKKLRDIEEILADEHLLVGLKYSINYLTQLINDSLNEGQEGGLYLFGDGTVAERLGSTVTSAGKGPVDTSRPHIYLSIIYYLKDFIDDADLSGLFMDRVLTEKEKLVLSEMRNKNIASLTIERRPEGALEITSRKTGLITAEQAREIKHILALNNYESITLHTRDKHSLSFSRTKKIRLI